MNFHREVWRECMMMCALLFHFPDDSPYKSNVAMGLTFCNTIYLAAILQAGYDVVV